MNLDKVIPGGNPSAPVPTLAPETPENGAAYTYNGKNTADLFYGSPDNDVFYANGGNDTIHAGLGDDTIYGQAGNDYLYGDAGDDVINGGNGGDLLVGGAGADIIWFGEPNSYDGNNFVYGGEQGGTGDQTSDLFVAQGAGGVTYVYDFECGIDKLVVFGFESGHLPAMLYDAVSNTLRIDTGPVGSFVFLVGVQQLTAADFVFLSATY
jgi:hypothetical protein